MSGNDSIDAAATIIKRSVWIAKPAKTRTKALRFSLLNSLLERLKFAFMDKFGDS